MGERDGPMLHTSWMFVFFFSDSVTNVLDVAVEVQVGCGTFFFEDYEGFLPEKNVQYDLENGRLGRRWFPFGMSGFMASCELSGVPYFK